MCAELFNNFFVNLGPNLANNVPQCNTNFYDYLQQSNSQSMFFAPSTKHEIIEVVKNMCNNKSKGFDFINCFVIKKVISQIAEPLNYIINLSLSTGVVPKDIKIAKVIPIYKKRFSHGAATVQPRHTHGQ